MHTKMYISQNISMKTSTKVLSILAALAFVPNIFLFKYLLQAFVPTGKGFQVHFTTLGWVALAFQILALVFGSILFFRFLKTQRLTNALFFSIFPLTLFYGLFVSYVASVKDMDGVTAQTVRHTLKISSTEKNYNNWLWIGLATLVYLILLFVVVMILCKPLSKVEKATKNLGDGRMKFDEFKVGGTKQFKEIENSLNKINYQYKQKENKAKQTDFGKQKSLSKQFFRFMGRENLASLEVGNQIKKNATVLLLDLGRAQKGDKTLSLEENFNYVNSYLKVVYPLIKRYNGFVDKYLGDGVLAVFSESQDAIECAHALTRAIDVKNKSQKERSALVCKIAIDTTDVVFGLIGDEQEAEPQIISDVLTNLKKMQEINSYIGSKVIFSKQALSVLSHNFQFDYRFTGVLTLDDEVQMPIYQSLETFSKHKKDKLKKLKNKFEAGVRAYNQQNYKSAKEEFEFVLHYVPDDKPSYVYFNKTLEKLKESA